MVSSLGTRDPAVALLVSGDGACDPAEVPVVSNEGAHSQAEVPVVSGDGVRDPLVVPLVSSEYGLCAATSSRVARPVERPQRTSHRLQTKARIPR